MSKFKFKAENPGKGAKEEELRRAVREKDKLFKRLLVLQRKV